MRTLALIPALICLSACSHMEFAQPDQSRLVCADEPAVPAPPVTDAVNGRYLKDMRGAWADCRSKVDWLRAWFGELNSK